MAVTKYNQHQNKIGQFQKSIPGKIKTHCMYPYPSAISQYNTYICGKYFVPFFVSVPPRFPLNVIEL